MYWTAKAVDEEEKQHLLMPRFSRRRRRIFFFVFFQEVADRWELIREKEVKGAI